MSAVDKINRTHRDGYYVDLVVYKAISANTVVANILRRQDLAC